MSGPRKTLRACLGLATILAVASCVSPSLPVPPPDPGAVVFHLDPSAGTATFHASARPDWADAKVSVYDRTTGRGVITTANADGSVDETPPFRAKDGDPVEVIYERPDQAAGLCLLLHEGRASDADRCQ